MITPRTVIGARFMKAGRMYFFETGGVNDVDVNEFVIVRTELGEDAARVAILPTDSPLVMIDPPLGTVVRRATGADLFTMNKHKRMEEDATRAAAEMVHARNLRVKILGADWQFDGSSLVFFFSSDERPDLSELNAALAAHFGTRKVLTADELGVSFAPIPAHTKGVGSYGSDEVPRQERPTPVTEAGDGQRKRRRRRGKRRGSRPPGP